MGLIMLFVVSADSGSWEIVSSVFCDFGIWQGLVGVLWRVPLQRSFVFASAGQTAYHLTSLITHFMLIYQAEGSWTIVRV